MFLAKNQISGFYHLYDKFFWRKTDGKLENAVMHSVCAKVCAFVTLSIFLTIGYKQTRSFDE